MASTAEYRVRTPTTYLLVAGLLFGLATIAGGAFAWMVNDGAPTHSYEGAVICAALVVLPFVYWASTKAYRVGGGRNLIRFHADRIEVPDVGTRRPLVIPRDSLRIASQVVRVRFRMVGTVTRGSLITFAGPGVTRKLSTLVLEDANDAPALLADLARFVSGEPAIGRTGHDAPKPRTSYDDRIDAELSKLED